MSTGEIDSQGNHMNIQLYILIQLELEMEIKESNRRYTGGKKYGEVGRRDRSQKSQSYNISYFQKGWGYTADISPRGSGLHVHSHHLSHLHQDITRKGNNISYFYFLSFNHMLEFKDEVGVYNTYTRIIDLIFGLISFF